MSTASNPDTSWSVNWVVGALVIVLLWQICVTAVDISEIRRADVIRSDVIVQLATQLAELREKKK